MSNPVDEYLGVDSEKSASLFGGMRDAFSKPKVTELAMQTLAVGGATALLGAAKSAIGAGLKSRNFREMMSVNPDLIEHQERDPKMFNQYYSSLHNMNPTFASDPVVAGSYMRKIVEFPGSAGNYLVEASGHTPRGGDGMRTYMQGLELARSVGPHQQSQGRLDDLRAEELRLKIKKLQGGGDDQGDASPAY